MAVRVFVGRMGSCCWVVRLHHTDLAVLQLLRYHCRSLNDVAVAVADVDVGVGVGVVGCSTLVEGDVAGVVVSAVSDVPLPVGRSLSVVSFHETTPR